jgi:hypothetical protein
MMKKALLSTAFWLLFALVPVSGYANDVGVEYVVKNGDSLYQLSRKIFGDARGVRKIVKINNEKAEDDKRFVLISIKTPLDIGQLLWIPFVKDSMVKDSMVKDSMVKDAMVKDAMVKDANDTPISQVSIKPDSSTPSMPATLPKSEQATIVMEPKTNCEIRIWYNYQIVAIAKINERWLANGVSLIDRAQRAYRLRHNARINGRFMMDDRFEVATLRDRDNKKYGDPDGPTFDYIVEGTRVKGFEGDGIYREIIKSSSRTNPVFNSSCIKG